MGLIAKDQDWDVLRLRTCALLSCFWAFEMAQLVGFSCDIRVFKSWRGSSLFGERHLVLLRLHDDTTLILNIPISQQTTFSILNCVCDFEL
jgi:hypothetical protein